MIRVFRLVQEVDETGVSGTGVMAEGAQLSNGLCVLSWLTIPRDWERLPLGVGVYESIEHVRAIHSHDGKTVVDWA